MEPEVVLTLTVLAFLVEAIVQTFKWCLETKERMPERFGALVAAIFITVASGWDVFPLLGLPLLLPYAGSVLTGVLLARGATVVHDLAALLQGVAFQNKLE